MRFRQPERRGAAAVRERAKTGPGDGPGGKGTRKIYGGGPFPRRVLTLQKWIFTTGTR
jgi:hypothetical protein